jgi:hypothetical protein
MFAAFILFIFGGYLWFKWLSPEADSRRKLLGVSTQIDQVKEGEVVKLVGKLRYPAGQQPLKAPISAKTCTYFQVVIEEGSGKHSQTVLEDEQSQAFLLEDGTGRALVQVEDADFVVRYDSIVLHEADERDRVMRYIADNAARARGTWDGQASRSAMERLLREGDKVAVLGQAAWEPDPEPGATGQGYREQARRLVIRAPAGGTVHVSDERTHC